MNTQTEVDTAPSVAELTREAERNYVSGTSQTSKYVSFQMYDTINTILAYLSSKHVSGEFDALGREKPFFNIVTALANIWFRATDIDRSDIRIRATKSADWIDSFLATVLVQDWMRRDNFGAFLNDWGRVLSRFGSAVVKMVENKDGLHFSVVSWSQFICDPVDFDANLKIEVLELTAAQLREKVQENGYDKAKVDALIKAGKPRETLDKKRKDNKSHYYKVYEVHGRLTVGTLKRAKGQPVIPGDDERYVDQIHAISFVGTKEGRTTKYEEFTLYAGQEDPVYMLTHLIEESDRTLAIGSVENAFQAQWQINDSMKKISDQLELASKLVFQTADQSFLGKNVLTDIEQGEIFTHAINMPLEPVNNTGHDIVGLQNYAVAWQTLAQQLNGVSEAMLGIAPKSGTAWRQTEALLNESYSLFELMTENKGLYIEQMFRTKVIPYLKRTKLNDSREIAAILKDNDIRRIDPIYLKGKAAHDFNRSMAKELIKGIIPTQNDQAQTMQATQTNAENNLNQFGNTRFFKPDEISNKTWATQLKDLEWELDIDVTGESKNIQDMLTTLNSALKLVLTPGFDQNPKAQAIVGRALELSGAMSAAEYNALPKAPPMPVAPTPAPVAAPPQIQPVGGGAPLTS